MKQTTAAAAPNRRFATVYESADAPSDLMAATRGGSARFGGGHVVEVGQQRGGDASEFNDIAAIEPIDDP